ncbi:MAG: NADH-quinone oxidoreductase subunit J [Wolbachia endosymbiont of Menacanthus eurysternus]|nr:MAG: NADH-quinone oxidoreductase subunit J [Wolbachia endosymbiont of Menacanthus eurysternus]
MIFFFYLFAIFNILSAICVISVNNTMYAVLFLILTFINSAALFILLKAEFIAMIILIVHVGAVIVLFIFVVMMLDTDYIKLHQGFVKYLTIGFVLCVVFLFIISFAIYNSESGINNNNAAISRIDNVKSIGNFLYTDYAYAFYLSGILLLVTSIGVIILTLHDKKKNKIKRQSVLKQLTQSSSVKLVKPEFRKGLEWK